MPICYLFDNSRTSQGCQSLVLNDQGTVEQPLQFRTFSEIQSLQQACKTWIVLPVSAISILQVELPWLAPRKARAALPFALEDKLSQSVEHLHFAFDKKYYHNNQYSVAITDKLQFSQKLDEYTQHGLDYHGITVDWCALQSGEACISNYGLVVNQPDFQGGLLPPLAENYKDAHPTVEYLQFSNSLALGELLSSQTLAEPYETWVAKRLIQQPILNLSQGDFQKMDQSAQNQHGLFVLLGLIGFWLLSILVVNGYKLHHLHQKIAEADAGIERIYKRFFPDAKQVISPRFRVERLLQGKGSQEQDRFLIMMAQFSKAQTSSKITVQQIRFQNNQLILAVTAADFSSLELVQTRLEEMGLKVKQTQASTQDKQVTATLELQ